VVDGAVMPRAGVDYPATWPAFEAWFPDDAACRAFLAGLRWPDGFVCPLCGEGDAWETGRGLWMCRGCGRQTSVTAGTIFHRSRLGLRSWFAAMWFVCAQKNGVSALGLQRVLGFGSYETAWAWMHKLRRAMVRPDRELLGGPGVAVELDETFIGAPAGLGKDGGRYGNKTEVVIAVERRHPKGLGRVRLEVIDTAARKADIFAFAAESSRPEPCSTPTAIGSTTTWPTTSASCMSDSCSRHQLNGLMTRCPRCTEWRRCSSAGSAAPSMTASSHRSCRITSTSSPSGSTGATAAAAACSFTDSANRP
jgi:hypothetical protein